MLNDDLATRHAAAIAEQLGVPGRMVALSKSGYRDAHPRHVAVFNANVCFSGGKVWWGDVDLTKDEARLIRLAAQAGETVYLLYEHDGRFDHEDGPLLDQAVYSVAPTGHTRFDHTHVERRADGVLSERPPLPRPRFRRPSPPRLWQPWRVERSSRRTNDASGSMYSGLVYIGRRGPGSPLLVLGFHRWSRHARGAWGEWTWYPSGHRSWAPCASGRLKWHRGPVRPFVAARLCPGVCHELRVGVAGGPVDSVWG